MEDWKHNINSIAELYPGHYQIILDFATIGILPFLVDPSFGLIWVVGHTPSFETEFATLTLPIAADKAIEVQARRLRYDFAMAAPDFVDIIKDLRGGITMIQVETLPRYYVDRDVMHERTFFDKLLTECNYHFFVDIPLATDYGRLISPSRAFLEALLAEPSLNWSDLP